MTECMNHGITSSQHVGQLLGHRPVLADIAHGMCEYSVLVSPSWGCVSVASNQADQQRLVQVDTGCVCAH